MLLTALGMDPGSDRSAFASVAFNGRRFELLYGRHLLFRGGVLYAGAVEPVLGRNEVAYLLDDVVAAGGLVALEHVCGNAYDQYRVPYLLETRGREERVVDMANERGITPVLIPAKEVRGELCRSESAGDGPVAAYIEAMVDGLTAMPESQRTHIYDAIAVAIVALCRAAKVQIPRTAASERALHEALQEEKVERATKRAKKKADEAAGKATKEKRHPTREMRARRRAGAAKGWATRRGA